jgi:hypothetical protein
VLGWRGALDNTRALALGFPVDGCIDTLLARHIHDVKLKVPGTPGLVS